jgi:hypothetical protein
VNNKWGDWQPGSGGSVISDRSFRQLVASLDLRCIIPPSKPCCPEIWLWR